MGNKQSHAATRKQHLMQLLMTGELLDVLIPEDFALRFGAVTDNQLNWTLLHLASWEGDLVLTMRLLDMSFPIDTKDVVRDRQHGKTALDLAIDLDHQEIIHLLRPGISPKFHQGEFDSVNETTDRTEASHGKQVHKFKGKGSALEHNSSIQTREEPLNKGQQIDYDPNLSFNHSTSNMLIEDEAVGMDFSFRESDVGLGPKPPQPEYNEYSV